MGSAQGLNPPGYPLVSFARRAKGYRSYPLRGKKKKNKNRRGRSGSPAACGCHDSPVFCGGKKCALIN
jgi:hypothetical protein